MVYQGVLIFRLLLGGFCTADKPPELLEADVMARNGRYGPAAICFLQYRARFPEYETYCTKRAAYCLAQSGENRRAIRLLRDFDDRAPEPDTPRGMIDRTRLRVLLARLYDRGDDPRRALRVLRRNPTFATHAERNLYILARLDLEEELEGVNPGEARRRLLAAALMSPPETPGRLTMLRKFIGYGHDNLSIMVEKIIRQDYFYNRNIQENN